MAIYRLSAAVVKRSAGHSAVAGAAYRAGEKLDDQRTGDTHDYTRRRGVLHTEIIAPENSPQWMLNREKLWNAVEIAEKRKDAQLAREVQLALPHEITHEQRIALVRDFVREEFVSRGMIADVAIHAPDRQGDQRNVHAHVMLTMRAITGDGFGKKCREWNADFARGKEEKGFVREAPQLEQWRESWASHVNRALERGGHADRVDHRSYEDQGVDKEPQPKVGPHASEMERRGEPSDKGEELRAVVERNRFREVLAAIKSVAAFVISVIRGRSRVMSDAEEVEQRDELQEAQALARAARDRERESRDREEDLSR